MNRGAPLKRSTKPLRRTSSLRTRSKKGVTLEARVFKNWWIGKPCASCRLKPAEVSHHVTLAQYLNPEDLWSLDNQMSLCRDCHNDHHSPNGPKIRRVDLSEVHLNFASRVLGGRAGSYFARRYA